MIDFQKTFTTKSIILRPIKSSDFEEMKKLTDEPELWTFFTSDLSDKNQLLKWITLAVNAIKSKERLALSIIDRKSTKIMGSTSLGNFSERDKRIEIGWTWLATKYRQQGVNQ